MSNKEIKVDGNLLKVDDKGNVLSMEKSDNYVHPFRAIWHEGSVELKFGEYSFNTKELGELLNELMEAKKASDKK